MDNKNDMGLEKNFSNMCIKTNSNNMEKLIKVIDNDERISKDIKLIINNHIYETFKHEKVNEIKKELNLTDLEIKIIRFIEEKGGPVRTLLIAEYIYGINATPKMINNTLYKMKNKNIIIKETDINNTKPRWYINKKYIYN